MLAVIAGILFIIAAVIVLVTGSGVAHWVLLLALLGACFVAFHLAARALLATPNRL